MKRSILLSITLLTLLASGAAMAQMTGEYKPSGDGAAKEYWLKNSNPLPGEDPRFVRANVIFNRIVAAADRRPGPAPELVVLDDEGYPWARSLPDGSIILTRGAIDIALKAKTKDDADARLAFIIGHELSHQVNGDFWHFFFYQGIHPESAGDERTKRTLKQVIKIAKSSDSVTAKELMADQYGLLYASQAGYNMRRIVDNDTNFFREWAAATSPGLLEGIVMQLNHPKIEERSAAVLLALNRVVEKIDRFERGIDAYSKGSLVAARVYFEDFLTVYQSREAYNNLGLVYYQMAAREYARWKPGGPKFRLSLIVDTATRAKETFSRKRENKFAARLRKAESPETKFHKYVDRAARYFREAAQRDHTYALAHNNMACVHFLKSEYSSAAGELDRALTLEPNLPEALNNRAVAYLKMGESLKVNLNEKVEADLLAALKLKPDYEDALYNIAGFYQRTGRMEEAAVFKRLLSKVNPDSGLVKLLR